MRATSPLSRTHQPKGATCGRRFERHGGSNTATHICPTPCEDVTAGGAMSRWTVADARSRHRTTDVWPLCARSNSTIVSSGRSSQLDTAGCMHAAGTQCPAMVGCMQRVALGVTGGVSQASPPWTFLTMHSSGGRTRPLKLRLFALLYRDHHVGTSLPERAVPS